MPATITQSAATVAIRAAANPEEIEPPVQAAIAVLFPAAVELVEGYAPEAPDSILNAAAVRVLGWLWESEPSEAQPLTGSGAAQLLANWRVHRAGAIGATAAGPGPTPTPTPGSGVPTPPPLGHYILTSENGSLEWVLFPAP